MSFFWGKKSLERMQGVNPYLVECANLAIASSIYDFSVPWMGGVRTAQEQNAIFKEGNSKCDGFDVLSFHQVEASDNCYGNALDVIPVADKPYEDLRKLNYFGRLMLTTWQELIFKYAQDGVDIGVMVWGGTFGASSWDRPHFEIRK
jgi:peptidoglycan L-alanyl-D-glutamate endopeptidase CwlK